MLEKTVEKYLVKKVKAAGGIALKLWPFSYVGVPDRLILLPKAKIFFIELKKDTGVLTKKQKAAHLVLKKLGFIVLVVRAKEQVDFILKPYETV